MKSNRSINKIKFFSLIWVLHIFVYYTIFVILLRIFENNYQEFYTVLGGFIGGIMGWFEQIPFFIIIPIIIMTILVNTIFVKKWYTAYIATVIISYLLDYLWLLLEGKNNSILFSTIHINLIYIVVPSLLATILINWLVFRRKYNRI